MTLPGDLSLDDDFVAKMDQIYMRSKQLDGNKSIRAAIKFDRRLTSFCRPRFHKPHPLALDSRGRQARPYFYCVNVVFALCVTITCVNMYHHYRHEYYLLQYDEFDRKRQDFSGGHADRIDAYLRERIETTGQELKAAGAPLISLVRIYPFVVVFYELITLIFGLYIYVFLILYFRLVEPIEKLYFFRVIENPRREQHMTHLLIRNEVNRVVESSRNHTKKLIDARVARLERSLKIGHHFYHQRDQITQLYLAVHKQIAMTLRAMCLRGQLNPISRSPEWIDRLALIYCVLTYQVYVVIFAIAPVILSIYLTVDFMAAIVVISQLGDCMILTLSGIHYLSSVVINLVDQIRSVIDIDTKMNHCIRKNETLLFGYLNKAHSKPNRELNEHLLLVLMEYKIYKSLLAEVYPIMGHLTSFSHLVVAVIPLVGKIHLVYMRIPAVRLYMLGLSVLVMIFVDIFVIPTCFLQSRCLRLQKSLAYLQGHVVWATSLDEDQPTYNKHTVWLLSSEFMNDNHPTANLFSYARALKLHFWFGVVALSLLFDSSNSSSGLVAGIFSDPLGLKRLEWLDFLA